MRTVITSLAALSLLVSSPAQGQHPAVSPGTRHGLTVSVGAGTGFAGATCGGSVLRQVCDRLDRSPGTFASLFVGQVVSRRLLVGVELEAMQIGGTALEGDIVFGSATVSARSFLFGSGLYVQGGAGLTWVGATSFGLASRSGGFADSDITGSRLGVSGGIGYDIPIFRFLAVTPSAQVVWGPRRALHQAGGGVADPSFGFTNARLGLAVTLR